MREILFKAKTIDGKRWVEGYYFAKPILNRYFIICDEAQWEVDADTICQYTGLTDKNGNKIWENDVCKGRYWENGNPHRLIGKVDYVYGEYLVCGVKQYEGFHSELNGAYEVIGNVFDNAELLEE